MEIAISILFLALAAWKVWRRAGNSRGKSGGRRFREPCLVLGSLLLAFTAVGPSVDRKLFVESQDRMLMLLGTPLALSAFLILTALLPRRAIISLVSVLIGIGLAELVASRVPSPIPTSVLRTVSGDPVALPHPRLGYTLNPNQVLKIRETHGGDVITEATYTIDAAGNRAHPCRHGSEPGSCILLFGCSFAFGHGLEDDETLGAVLEQEIPGCHVRNLAVLGYGPAQVLGIVDGWAKTGTAPCARGIALYIVMEDHVNRAVGGLHPVMTWAGEFPAFDTGSDGNVQFTGTFLETISPWQLGLWSLLIKSKVEDRFHLSGLFAHSERSFRRTSRIIAAARERLLRIWPGSELYVLPYPGHATGLRLVPYLGEVGVPVFDVSGTIDPRDPSNGLHRRDAHPSALAGSRLGRAIAGAIRTGKLRPGSSAPMATPGIER